MVSETPRRDPLRAVNPPSATPLDGATLRLPDATLTVEHHRPTLLAWRTTPRTVALPWQEATGVVAVRSMIPRVLTLVAGAAAAMVVVGGCGDSMSDAVGGVSTTSPDMSGTREGCDDYVTYLATGERYDDSCGSAALQLWRCSKHRNEW